MGIENNAKKHLERKSNMKKKRILALAMVLCMSLMLAACGSTPTNSDPADTGSGDDEVSTTKTLTMAIAAETTTLSPLYMGNANMCTDMLVYENLVNYENGEIVPGLAERWEFSDDGCTLTFYLRPGVTFHDGTPCDAEAVKANLEHKQSNPSFYTLKAVTDIESMETVDDTTLVIHYTHPYFAYLNDFCWNDVMTICAPSLLIEGDFQTVSGVSGTGPYVYDEYVAGEYTRFVRNENYWGDISQQYIHKGEAMEITMQSIRSVLTPETADSEYVIRTKVNELQKERRTLIAKALEENDDGKYDFQFLRIKNELEQLQAQLEGVQAAQKSQTADKARMAEIAALLEQFRESGLSFDNVLVRKVVETVRVESAEKLEITFTDGNRRVVPISEGR